MLDLDLRAGGRALCRLRRVRAVLPEADRAPRVEAGVREQSGVRKEGGCAVSIRLRSGGNFTEQIGVEGDEEGR